VLHRDSTHNEHAARRLVGRPGPAAHGAVRVDAAGPGTRQGCGV